MSSQTTFKKVYRPVTKAIDETLLSSALDFSGRSTNLDFSADQTLTFDSLSNIEHFTDGQIIVLFNRTNSNITLSGNLFITNNNVLINPGTASAFTYSISQQKLFKISGSSDDDLFIKEKILIQNSSQLNYIDLQHNAVPNSIVATIGRLSAHIDEDFTTSVESGITRITWINSFAQPAGEEKMEIGDSVFLNYKISTSGIYL